MKSVLTTILMGCLVLSCSSDNNSAQEPETEETSTEHLSGFNLIKQITKNGIVTNTFEYWENRKIKIRNWKRDNGNPWVKDSIYYENNTVFINSENLENNSVNLITFYAADNDQYIMEYDYGSSYSNEIATYEVDDSGCGFGSVESRFESTDGLVDIVTYEYTDTNCSYIETISRDGTSIFSQKAFKGDGMNSYRKTHFEDIFLNNSIGKGNTLELEIISQQGNSNTSSYTSEFEYNADDFPTYEKRVYEDGSFDEFHYEYY
nr:hypothetical protein [uncultured Allomuricauda sp.]